MFNDFSLFSVLIILSKLHSVDFFTESPFLLKKTTTVTSQRKAFFCPYSLTMRFTVMRSHGCIGGQPRHAPKN